MNMFWRVLEVRKQVRQCTVTARMHDRKTDKADGAWEPEPVCDLWPYLVKLRMGEIPA